MEEALLKSDVFFIVTTIAVLVMTLLMGVVIVYIIRIVRDIDYIARKVKGGVKEVVEDITVLHRIVRKKDRFIESLIESFIKKFTKKHKK